MLHCVDGIHGLELRTVTATLLRRNIIVTEIHSRPAAAQERKKERDKTNKAAEFRLNARLQELVTKEAVSSNAFFRHI